MKNSSRLESKMAMNFSRSSSGFSASSASCRTRALNSSQESSQLMRGALSPADLSIVSIRFGSDTSLDLRHSGRLHRKNAKNCFIPGGGVHGSPCDNRATGEKLLFPRLFTWIVTPPLRLRHLPPLRSASDVNIHLVKEDDVDDGQSRPARPQQALEPAARMDPAPVPGARELHRAAGGLSTLPRARHGFRDDQRSRLDRRRPGDRPPAGHLPFLG